MAEKCMEGDEINREVKEAESPTCNKSRPTTSFLSLSRCAACYNHKKNTTSWLGGNGESSSSAEESGPDVDSESEAESSSSSSSSSQESLPEEPAVDEEEETGEEAEEQQSSQDAPLGRPETIVSTLNLKVLPQNPNGDDFCIVEVAEEAAEAAGGGHQYLQDGLPWQQWPQPPVRQQQLSQHYQTMQLQPCLAAPPTTGGQRSAPAFDGPAMMQPHLPPHAALWGPGPPQAHLEAPGSQQCWYCASTPYWNHLCPANGTR